MGNNSADLMARERLANEELLERLQQQIYADHGRLEAGNKPVYTGKMISPMSSMTQNARLMRQHFANKIPKQKKIDSLLRRESKGWSPEQTRNMLSMLKRGENSEQQALERLQKQFGKNFGYEAARGNRLKTKIGKDIDQNLEMSKVNLKNMDDEIKNMERERSIKSANSLQKAAGLKTARREALVKQLEDFGNQEHVLNNLKLKAERDAFEEEKNAPYKKIEMAKRALAGLNIDPNEAHPDRERLQNQLLQKINNAYTYPYQGYKGQRVIGVEPETESSFNMSQMISPKYKDAFAKKRKAIEQDVLNNSLADKIYNRIPESVEPLMGNIDTLARKQLKAETRNIGGHYARQGTYGSQAHKAANEQALRDVLRRVQAEREGALLTGIKGQKNLIGREEANALNQYGMMADEGAKEFGNILLENERLNQLGWKKRANKQGEENQAMQSWYGQLADEWPMVNYGPSYRNVDMSPFESMARGYGTDLTDLFSQPALYNENEKAFNAYRNEHDKKIKDYESYILNSQKAKVASAITANLQRDRDLAEYNRRQAERNAAFNARWEQRHQPKQPSAYELQRNQAWQNYQNVVSKAHKWFDFGGLLTPVGREAPVDERVKVFKMIQHGPGLPHSGSNRMYHDQHFGQNAGMTREEFDAVPATLAWTNYLG